MTTPSPFPTVATKRLILRPFAIDDIAPLYHIMNEPDIMRYFPTPTAPDWGRVERIVNRQLEYWNTYGYAWWVVTLPDTHAMIGWCGLQFLPETGETEVGYLLSRPYWSKGLATEAARKSVAYGLEVHHLPYIIGLTHPDNIASQRVLEKAGLTFIGEAFYFNMACRRFLVAQPAEV